MVLNTIKLNSTFSASQTKLTFKVKLLQIVLVLLVAVVGDGFVDLFTSHKLFKCISDNGTHFLIAVLSWMFIEEIDFSTIPVGSLLLCGMMASVIDLDHFVAARSFNIHVIHFVSSFWKTFSSVSSLQFFSFFWLFQEATSLSFRPILHWTTLPVTCFVFLVILALILYSLNLYKFAWMFLTAFITHHWRDGYRRGLWIYPLPSIPPFSYSIYLLGLVAILLCFNFFMYHPLIINHLKQIQPENRFPALPTKISKIQTVWQLLIQYLNLLKDFNDFMGMM